MSLVTVAMLVVLGGSLPAHAPDLQVEAATAAGASLPELADAVARALVASGARVVLGGATSVPCQYCAKVMVTEAQAGTCRVEVSQDRHKATANLNLPTSSSLFDRARAIAIQARLLVTWETSEERRSKEVTSRPSMRKPEAKPAERPLPSPEVATVTPVPPPVYERLPSAAELVPSPASEPAAIEERGTEVAEATLADSRGEVSGASPSPDGSGRAREGSPSPRAESKPVVRPEAMLESHAEVKPPERNRVEKRALPPASTESSAGPPKPLWPWIPTALGVGAGIGAGVCALVARQRYNGLSDRTRGYNDAKALKDSGETWQLASFILSGVAVAGIGTGIIGFATRSSASAVASPLPGGGMIAIAGGLP